MRTSRSDAPDRATSRPCPRPTCTCTSPGPCGSRRCARCRRRTGCACRPRCEADWPVTFETRDERGWFRFQSLYDAARACVRGEADMRRIVREAALDDGAEGSRWLEIQVDPTSYAPFVGGITPALEIVLDEAAAVSREPGAAQVGVIVAASRMRHELESRTLARLAARYAGEGPGAVVGFGLSNDERRGDTESFAAAFAIARRAGLALVPHAGELLGPDAVERTLTSLAAGPAGARGAVGGGSADAGPGGGRRGGARGVPREQPLARGLSTRSRTCRCGSSSTQGRRWPWGPTTR